MIRERRSLDLRLVSLATASFNAFVSTAGGPRELVRCTSARCGDQQGASISRDEYSALAGLECGWTSVAIAPSMCPREFVLRSPGERGLTRPRRCPRHRSDEGLSRRGACAVRSSIPAQSSVARAPQPARGCAGLSMCRPRGRHLRAMKLRCAASKPSFEAERGTSQGARRTAPLRAIPQASGAALPGAQESPK